eukprot:scaffold15179_cov70-Skeletonema_dohrnii-CCMP3373.AAC.2
MSELMRYRNSAAGRNHDSNACFAASSYGLGSLTGTGYAHTLTVGTAPLALAQKTASGWFNALPNDMQPLFNLNTTTTDTKTILEAYSKLYLKMEKRASQRNDPNHIPISARVKCNVDSLSKGAKATPEYRTLVAQAAALQEQAQKILAPSGRAAFDLEINVLRVERMKLTCDMLTTAAKGVSAFFALDGKMYKQVAFHHGVMANFLAMFKSAVEEALGAPMYEIIECYEAANNGIHLPSVKYEDGNDFLEVVANEKKAAEVLKLQQKKAAEEMALNNTKTAASSSGSTKVATPHRFYRVPTQMPLPVQPVQPSASAVETQMPLPAKPSASAVEAQEESVRGSSPAKFIGPAPLLNLAEDDDVSRFSEAEAEADGPKLPNEELEALSEAHQESGDFVLPRILFPKVDDFQGSLFEIGGRGNRGGYTPVQQPPTIEGGGEAAVLSIRGGGSGDDDDVPVELPAPLTLFKKTTVNDGSCFQKATMAIALFFNLAVAKPIEAYQAQVDFNNRARRVQMATKMDKKEKKANATMKLLNQETPIETSLITAIVKNMIAKEREKQAEHRKAAAEKQRKAAEKKKVQEKKRKADTPPSTSSSSSSKKGKRGGAGPPSASTKKRTGFTPKNGAGKGGKKKKLPEASGGQRKGKNGRK